jgi:hypothetical protein
LRGLRDFHSNSRKLRCQYICKLANVVEGVYTWRVWKYPEIKFHSKEPEKKLNHTEEGLTRVTCTGPLNFRNWWHTQYKHGTFPIVLW